VHKFRSSSKIPSDPQIWQRYSLLDSFDYVSMKSRMEKDHHTFPWHIPIFFNQFQSTQNKARTTAPLTNDHAALDQRITRNLLLSLNEPGNKLLAIWGMA
jgi:hypothetical protein